MGNATTILNDCLYFTAGALSRKLTAMADDAFVATGLNPSQGFALMCIVEEPGVAIGEIAKRLELAPSTLTRVVETLERQGLATTEKIGRSQRASPTKEGKRKQKRVKNAWHELYLAYSELLGEEQGRELCQQIHRASKKLQQQDEQTKDSVK